MLWATNLWRICQCYWPWGGMNCQGCAQPGYVEIRHSFQCVPCIPPNDPRPLFAVSESPSYAYNIPLLVADCAPGLAILGAARGTSGGATGSTALVDLPMPNSTSTTFTTTACTDTQDVGYHFLYATHWFNDAPFLLATIRCVPLFTFAEVALLPRVVQVHFVSSSDVTAAAAVGILAALWRQAADAPAGRSTVHFTFAGVDASFAYDTKTHAFTAVQQWLTDVGVFLAPSSSTTAASCRANIRQDFTQQTAPAILLLLGDIGVGCTLQTAFTTEVRDIVSDLPAVGIFWITQKGTIPPFIFGKNFFSIDRPLEPVYSAFAAFVKERSTVTCNGEISFSPQAVPVGQRAKLTFRGICDFVFACFIGPHGSACTSQLGVTGRRAFVYTPYFLFTGSYRIALASRANTRIQFSPENLLDVFATGPQAAVYAARRLDTYSLVAAQGYNQRTLLPTVVASVRRVAQDLWSADKTTSAAASNRNSKTTDATGNAKLKPVVCCAIVALSMTPLGGDNPTAAFFAGTASASQCMSNGDATSLAVPSWTMPLHVAEAQTLALRCVPQAVVDPYFPVVSARTTGSGDVVSTLLPRRRGGRQFTNSVLDGTPGDIKAARIAAMLKVLLAQAKDTSSGRSLQRVFDAVASIGLRSSYPSEERVCERNEVPFTEARCFFPWSARAEDAGNYLTTAGFVAVASDWYLNNALVGDIAVLPGAAFLDGVTGDVIEFDAGHIMMKYRESTTDGRDWVSDTYTTHNVFPGLLDTPTTLPAVFLYRLMEEAEIAAVPGEYIVPFSSDDAVSNPTAWTSQWARYDATVTPVGSIARDAAQHFSCPASTDGAFPQQLWLFPLHPAMATTASICYRLLPSGDRTYGLRCCYDGQGAYLGTWPSQIEYQVPALRSIQDVMDPELVACLRPGGTSDSCKVYRTRRPPPGSTNSPYDGAQKWSPSVRWGGALGDPHCSSYDGVNFECNFRGEAVWTRCGDWAVHAVADTIGSGAATVITRVAVRSTSDTFFGLLDPNATAGFSLYLNDMLVSPVGALGGNMTVIVDNRTVTVIDGTGNMARMIFEGRLIVLATIPSAAACANQTDGLCGNNNGDPADDLLPYSTNPENRPLPLNSTNETIYTSYVLSWLVLSLQESLFPQPLFFQGNLSYLPKFANATEVLRGCPSACRNDTACCFDVSVGGPTMAASFNSAKSLFNAAEALAVKAESIAAVAKLPFVTPRFVDTPANIQLDEFLLSTDVIVLPFTLRWDHKVSELIAFACNVCPDYTDELLKIEEALQGTGRNVSAVPYNPHPGAYAGCTAPATLSGNRTRLTIKAVEVSKSFSTTCIAAVLPDKLRRNSSEIFLLRAIMTVSTYDNLLISTPVPLSQQVPIPEGSVPQVVPRWTPAPLAAPGQQQQPFVAALLVLLLLSAALFV